MESGLPPPANNAAVIEYLLSDRARDVNGQIVRMDAKEVFLVGHPALLLPSIEDPEGWTSAKLADAFDRDFKKRLIPAGAITGVNHDDESVMVNMTKEQIKAAPDHDADRWGDETRDQHADYYGPFSW